MVADVVRRGALTHRLVGIRLRADRLSPKTYREKKWRVGGGRGGDGSSSKALISLFVAGRLKTDWKHNQVYSQMGIRSGRD